MRDKILPIIGFSMLALCFVASLTRIALFDTQSKEITAAHGKLRTIRLAHWQLETGVRTAFDRIGEEYTKLHPNVRIEQLPIPESIFPNWLVTQLVGGTAPDILSVGYGITDEQIARYMLPLSDIAETPNPYNAGTELAGRPLRETIVDGMVNSFVPNLLDYYGVPVSLHTLRIFVNLDLLQAIQGNEHIPQTYEELIQACNATEQYARAKNLSLVPIAGSKYNSPILMARLFGSQTQVLSESLAPVGLMGVDALRYADDYLSKRWSLETPDVRSGYTLMHDVTKYMQPGFLQSNRDDANLRFAQGHALMITTGSWDATSIRAQANFRVGVGPMPVPSPQNATYGKYTLGSFTEASTGTGVGFGLTRSSPNLDIARDYLRFLVSQRMSQLFTDVSGWPPSVVGVKTSPQVAAFMPIMDGYLSGLLPTFDGGAFGDVNRVVNTNMHRLAGPLGSAQTFIDAIRPEYQEALRTSLIAGVLINGDTVQRSDTQLAALAWQAQKHPNDARAGQRLNIFLQAAILNQRSDAQLRALRDKANRLQPK